MNRPHLPLDPSKLNSNPRGRNVPNIFSRDIKQNNKIINIHKIDEFLNEELANAHSDSDKMFVYQRAFDYLINEFMICRPLLERIKQQYDAISTDLISKKREIVTNTTSVTAAEDSYSEMINELRRARTQEFAQKKSESEKLLDEMTELRIQRSKLLDQLSDLTQKEEELSSTETSNDEKMIELTVKMHELVDFIRETETSSISSRSQISNLQERITKTQQSADELHRKDIQLKNEINNLENEEKILKSNIEKFGNDTKTMKREIFDLQKESDSLAQKKGNMNAKLESLKKNTLDNETILRGMVEGTDIDPNLPIDDLIAKVQELIGQ